MSEFEPIHKDFGALAKSDGANAGRLEILDLRIGESSAEEEILFKRALFDDEIESMLFLKLGMDFFGPFACQGTRLQRFEKGADFRLFFSDQTADATPKRYTCDRDLANPIRSLCRKCRKGMTIF